MGMYNLDKDGTPDYDTWLKMKEFEEKKSPDQALYEAIGKTVNYCYGGSNDSPPDSSLYRK